jgi:hypothetical protein
VLVPRAFCVLFLFFCFVLFGALSRIRVLGPSRGCSRVLGYGGRAPPALDSPPFPLFWPFTRGVAFSRGVSSCSAAVLVLSRVLKLRLAFVFPDSAPCPPGWRGLAVFASLLAIDVVTWCSPRAGPKPRQARDGHSLRMGPLFSCCQRAPRFSAPPAGGVRKAGVRYPA